MYAEDVIMDAARIMGEENDNNYLLLNIIDK